MFSTLKRLQRWRTQRVLKRHPLPPGEWRRLMREAALFAGLGALERVRLRVLTTLFLQRKKLNGVQGLSVTPGIAVAIAAQACLPILNLGLDCYDDWVEVVIYPGAFRVARETRDESGLVSHHEQILSGESWLQGPVILSWDDVAADLAHPSDHNVVIHEFAHKLDMLDGSANGMPPLHAGMVRQQWTTAFSAAFTLLQQQEYDFGHTVIDAYGATNPAEFFAVASEYFFTDPHTLRHEFPAVYTQLALFYHQDPARRAHGETKGGLTPES